MSQVGLRVFVAHPTLVWAAGRIVSADEQTIAVQVGDDVGGSEENSLITVSASEWETKLLLAHENEEQVRTSFDDLCEMTALHNAAVLHNVRKRYATKEIYTQAKHVIVALNPYDHTNLYTPEMRMKYKGRQATSLPPHLYKISSMAFADLVENQRAQTIVVSGESGAGKTETVKILMTHISTLAECEDSDLIHKIVSANSVLECFGNAKTSKNDNSSRYGKLLSLQFNQNNQIIGGAIRPYLLEKNRVAVRSAESESNFHCFYALFTGDEEMRRKLKIFNTAPSELKTLQGMQSNRLFEFETLLSDLQCCLDIDRENAISIIQVVSAVLLSGEIDCVSEDQIDPALEIVGELLGIEPPKLREFLRFRTITVCGQEVQSQLNESQRFFRRDAFAAEIFSLLFHSIIAKINATLRNERSEDQASASSSPQAPTSVVATISLLDIFGFEVLRKNSLEQLLINYANEKLHVHFVHNSVLSVQMEYEEENINFPSFSFPDLDQIITAMEAKQGVIDALHEQVMVAQGSDSAVVNAIAKKQKEGQSMGIEVQRSMRAFVVRHFAGNVEYDIEGMVSRNRDCSLGNLDALLMSSGNAIVKALARPPNTSNEASAPAKSASSSFIKSDSIAKRFKNDLQSILHTLETTNTHYVRCLRPNASQSPWQFDSALVQTQLQYSGIVEAASIARLAFPCKMLYNSFFDAFYCLLPPQERFNATADQTKKINVIIDRICASSDKTEREKSVQVGKSKVFLVPELWSSLEKAKRNILAAAAVRIQAAFRCYRIRIRYLRILKAIETLQHLFHLLICRHRYLKIKAATMRTQSVVRMWQAKASARMRRNAIVKLQSALRRRTAQQLARFRKEFIVTLQSLVRMYRVKRTLARMKVAAAKCQSCWRAHVAKRTLAKIKRATIIFQSHWRARVARLVVVKIKRAIVKCQSRWRAYSASRTMARIKKAAVQCQSCWRAHVAKRKLFLRRREGMLIQQEERKSQGIHLQRLRAAVCIQSLVRGRMQRSHWRRISKATRLLQRRWRKYLRDRRVQHPLALAAPPPSCSPFVPHAHGTPLSEEDDARLLATDHRISTGGNAASEGGLSSENLLIASTTNQTTREEVTLSASVDLLPHEEFSPLYKSTPTSALRQDENNIRKETLVQEEVPEPTHELVHETQLEIVQELIEKLMQEVIHKSEPKPVPETVRELVQEAVFAPVEELVQEPEQVFVHESVFEQVQELTQVILQEPPQDLGFESALERVQGLIEEPLQKLMQSPISEPVRELIEEPMQEFVQEAVFEVVEDLIEEPVQEPAQQLIMEPVRELVQRLAQESVLEPVAESVLESVLEPAPESILGPVQETQAVLEPVQNSVKQLTQEFMQEPAQELSEELAEVAPNHFPSVPPEYARVDEEVQTSSLWSVERNICKSNREDSEAYLLLLLLMVLLSAAPILFNL